MHYLLLITLKSLIVSAIFGTVLGAFASFKADSFFWNEETLPELDSFIFNLVEGKSKDWGTEPLYAYFTKYLPHIFMIPLIPLMALYGFNDDLVNYGVGTVKTVTISSVLFIFVMSLQPHKEWRFIVYSLPGITIAASNGIVKIMEKAKSYRSLFKFVVIAICLCNYLLSLFAGYVSSFNYPGGEALTNLNLKLFRENQAGTLRPITVHMDVATCMSGATLFNRMDDSKFEITYDKTENSFKLDQLWNTFDYVITEIDNEKELLVENGCQWVKIDVVDKLSGLDKASIISHAKNPLKTFNEVKAAFHNRNTGYLVNFIHLEPEIFVYEKMCTVV
ncbi:hypothetical protein FOA43_004766 [Brettanomyces nanus]|uniref:Mannosyltransferase n=1 Tax=Eeniella nana TaxID=13502 RepID=A0A875SFJ4_EENNA|nr:uncharacterized protein FOA43_004766 [Brettanomyces nanus]QPG77354.1 hypothetical protein FOA43_004766 [Brettanomyces nanus]